MASKTISESELCAAFISWADRQGWKAYPETGEWDIVLVRDGIQIGVQAKKHFNATLLRQVLPQGPNWWGTRECGPRYRAILLPKWSRDIQHACDFCGLVFFYPGRTKSFRSPGDGPFDADFRPAIDFEEWQQWPGIGVKLPGYVPDVPAGASCPIRLTEWKVGALRITALLEIRGYVEREDFKYAGIDHRRWVPMKWLRIEDGRYVRGEHLGFDRQHPKVYQEILAEERARLEAINA